MVKGRAFMVPLAPLVAVLTLGAGSSSALSASQVSTPTFQPSKATPTTAPRPAPEVATPLHVTANDLNSQLGQGAPNAFAGMEVTPDQQGLIIHVVDSGLQQVQQIVSQRLQALGHQALPASEITYVSATASLASLQSRQEQLTAAYPQLSAQGVNISSYSLDIANDSLHVTVQGLTPTDENAIAAVVGSQNLIVTELPRATAYSRTTDSLPWWGGDWIQSSNLYCTSGFSMVDGSGITYNSTAAHCDNTPNHNDTFVHICPEWSRLRCHHQVGAL